MEHDPSRIESRIEEICRRLAEIEHRLDVLERSSVRGGGPPAGVRPGEAQAPGTEARKPPARAVLPLIGRTLVVLGGAFLLRAITESGAVSQGPGTALGIGYALFRIVLADRAAGRNQSASATSHGLAAAIIAFPLLWEATGKFGFLSPMAGAMALAGATALGLAVAWRRGLAPLAWFFTMGGAAAALSLAFATRMFLPFVSCLLFLGLATLWLGYVRDWHTLAWPMAGLADVTVLLMAATLFLGPTRAGEPVLGHGSLLTLQLALVLVYFGSFAARTLARGLDVTVAEILQAMAVFVIGLGGAIAVVRATGTASAVLGTVSLGFSVGGYGLSFTFIDRRRGRRRNFIFYSTAALLFTVVAFGALLEGSALAIGFAVVALLTAWLGGHQSRATLSLHGAAYAAMAAVFSGLLSHVSDVFLGSASEPRSWMTASMLVVIGASATCCWFPVATHGRTWGRFSRVPKLVVLAILLSGLGALLVTLGTRLLPDERAADPAIVSSTRTGVLAVSALVVARAGRWKRIPEATLLAYPVLILGGLKLLFEDLRAGRPGTLFVSLVLYGSALILVPRLLRRSP
ncbi:MAG: hypothetical protein ACE5G2_10525 [Candidatus Krumholzibacteriia bacterium]